MSEFRKNLQMESDQIVIINACHVCDDLFTADDRLDFVCPSCLSLMTCLCGSDDIDFYWSVDLDNAKKPYSWHIQCGRCASDIERDCSQEDFKSTAKQLFEEWQSSVRKTLERLTMTEIDWQAWHELMESYGWRPVRDVFGAVVQYTLPRPGIGKPLVLNAGDFTEWAGLMQTPPPF